MKVIIRILSGFLFFVSFASYSAVLNENNPDGYKNFRMDYHEMVEITNPTKLSHRIFYKKPSTGPNAQWFDAIKQGNIAKVKEMVSNGQNIEVKDNDELG
ncbi:hypothetical protein RHO12_06075 [Orbus sturtevantii]|uniref:hypothetical protein n=1 Tax=Orbus sturtevantii TaxID=3074109 RepID=UPI00370DDE6D